MPSAFETISEFIINLYNYFQKNNYHSLNLYHRLITSHKHDDTQTLEKHLQVWREFCMKNRTAIRERSTPFTKGKIAFSNKIYIDLNILFPQADKNTADVMWEYILTISAYLDPVNNTKQVLSQLKAHEEEQEQAIPSQMEGMDMLGGLINSNIMGDMMQKLLGSGLDLDGLANTAMTLVSVVQKEVEVSNDPNLIAISKLLGETMPKPPADEHKFDCNPVVDEEDTQTS